VAASLYSGGCGDVLRLLGAVPRSTHHHQLCRRRRLDAGTHRIPARTLSRLRYALCSAFVFSVRYMPSPVRLSSVVCLSVVCNARAPY